MRTITEGNEVFSCGNPSPGCRKSLGSVGSAEEVSPFWTGSGSRSQGQAWAVAQGRVALSEARGKPSTDMVTLEMGNKRPLKKVFQNITLGIFTVD